MKQLKNLLRAAAVPLRCFPQTLVIFLFAFGGNAAAQQSDSIQPGRPFLLVAGSFDRNYVSRPDTRFSPVRI
jgi:hypothetical protein